MEAEAVAQAVQEGPDGELGLGVHATDAGHEGGAGGWGEGVGQMGPPQAN